MEQTAVEWLAGKYNCITWLRNRDEISPSNADDLRKSYLKEAKEMENKQIIDAWIDGKENKKIGNTVFEDAEQYYKETFFQS